MRRLQALIATAIGSGFVFIGGVAIAPIASAQDDEVVDLIIVTAQKRSEVLTDVPMSITVLGGETLERQQIYNFEDLVTKVPGLSLDSSERGGSRITLRGINTGGVASTIGVYVDDVPFGSSTALANGGVLAGDFDTFDLARIEVLRGPQGTLYGASSLGGTLRYITNPPNTEEFEFRAQASVESVDGGDTGYAATGVVNIPFANNFAVRASGFYRSDGGWIDSIGNNPIPSLTDPLNPAVAGTRVEQDINSVDTFGGRVSALFDISEDVSLRLGVLAQNIESDAPNYVDADPSTLEPVDGGNIRSRYQLDFNNVEYRVYSANLDWDFRPFVLQSITSYATSEQDFQDDIAANTGLLGGVPVASLTTALLGDPVTRPLSGILQQVTSTDKFTQELRLISEDSDTFEWVAGVYYTQEDSEINPQNLYPVESGTETIATDLPLIAEVTVISDYEEFAAFANATWHVSPRFDLSFGGRWSDNDQTASQTLEIGLVGAVQDFDPASSSESPFTWSISPRFAVSDNASLYVRVATGFRPGGPNVLPAGAPAGVPTFYKSDELTSYEVGFKADSPGGMLSIDMNGYFLDWEDVQLIVNVNGVNVNGNGGTAESKGFEFSATARPVDGLDLLFNWSYTDAYLTQDTDPIIGGMKGDPLSFIPKWTFGFGANYSWSLAGDSTAYVGGNVAYVGERFEGYGSLAPDGSLRKVDPYSTVDARGGVDFGQWYVEVYAKNLSDEQGANSVLGEGILPNGLVGLSLIRPRTYGLSFGFRY